MLRATARLASHQQQQHQQGAAAAVAAAGYGRGFDRAAQAGGGNHHHHSNHHKPEMSEFVRRASQLKNRLRGRSQYAFARAEAQRFLDAEVPKSSVSAWMDASGNAIALSQLLRFFEVQPDATLLALLLNTLVRTAEDAAVDPVSRLEAVLALTAMRLDENFERAFSTIEDVLKRHSQSSGEGQGGQTGTWQIINVSAKILQRCGKRVPTALSDRLAAAVAAQLRATPQADLTLYQRSLLRVYSWMVRAERPEARHILFALVTHTGDFAVYDYSTLLTACWRHHQLDPLPVELVQRLARTGLDYCTTASGRDTATVISTIARMLNALEAGANGVGAKDRAELQNRFSALLEDYQPRVLRFMDSRDKLYWKRTEDITSIVFGYELSGHLRYRAVFEAFDGYVAAEVGTFEPTQLAMATGILRRSQLLTPALAESLSARIEVVLGELKLAEISHICATFAALPQPPEWMGEAHAVAMRLPMADASGLTLLNLAVAYPGDTTLTQRVPYDKLTARQLTDTLPLVLGDGAFEAPVVAALVARLGDPTERISPDGVQVLLASNRPALAAAVYTYLSRRFAEPEWDTDTLHYLAVVGPSGQHGPAAHDPAKALAAAQAAAISPEQFVALAELLVALFGGSDDAIAAFVRTGGDDLLTAGRVLTRTAVRYLAAVRAVPSLRPTEAWLGVFAEKLGTHMRRLKPAELESLLMSLHVVYSDVARTPAMQLVLSEVVEGCYPTLRSPDAQTARMTVLLVYLQRGMSFPLLTDQTAMVAAVRAAAVAAAYPQDISDAVASMPLPAVTKSKRGRFVLKQVPAAEEEDGMDGTHPLLDLSMGEDPFACPIATEAPAAVEPTPVAAPVPKPEPVPETVEAPQAPEPVPAPEAVPAPAPAPTSVAPPAPEVPATEQSEKECQTSYYAKFFNSSVGQILTGRGANDADSDDAPKVNPATHRTQPQHQHQQQQQQANAYEETESTGLRPRRTRLAPSAAAAPPAATPTEQQQQQQRPAADSGFFASWGSPPTFAGSAKPVQHQQQQQVQNQQHRQQQQQQPQQPFPAAATPYGIPTATQNNALFSSLFDSDNAASPLPPPQHQQQQRQPTSFGSLFGDSPPTAAAANASGLRVPPGTVDPTAWPAVMSRATRPVITRRAVMTRGGGGVSGGSGGGGASQEDGARAMEEGIASIYADHALPLQLRAASAPAGEPELVLDARAGGQPAAGAAGFMNKLGLAKISGYNMDGADLGDEEAAAGGGGGDPQQQQQSQLPIRRYQLYQQQQMIRQQGGTPAHDPTLSRGATGQQHAEHQQQQQQQQRPLAWQEAARQVGRISRIAKTKTRTRTQQSLSQWLDAPTKRLDDPLPNDEAPAVSRSGVKARKAAAKKAAKAAKKAALAEELAAKKAAKSAAAAAKKMAKAAAAVAKKGGARKAAAKKATTAKKVAAKAAVKPKSKPKPKPKKVAPAKKPAPKKAKGKKPAANKAGKGKKK